MARDKATRVDRTRVTVKKQDQRPLSFSDLSGTLPAGVMVFGQAEIDFGATPLAEQQFTVADASVTPTSRIIGGVAYEAPTGKDLDELEMDAIDVKFAPGSGSFTVRVKGLEGYLHDKFKINYAVGS